MAELLPAIRRVMVRWISEFPERAERKGLRLQPVRFRIIPFTSGEIQPPATPFMTLASFDGRLRGKGLNTIKKLADEVERSTQVSRGDATPPRALEALESAMRSDWVHNDGKWQRIIVVFTDSVPALSVQPALKSSNPEMSQVDRLTDLWEESTTLRMRLVLFAPDTHPWDDIGDSWGMTLYCPFWAGDNLLLEDPDFDILFELVLNSWM